MRISFTEEQRFDQIWMWAILIVLAMIPIVLVLSQTILDRPIGNHPMSNAELTFVAIATFLPLILFSIIRLTTEIDDHMIRMQFFPFVKKEIKWEDVAEAKVIDYGFVGGWGIRLFTRYGTVYNISGRMGLFLRLKNGKKLLIGTQKPEELTRVLNAMKQ